MALRITQGMMYGSAINGMNRNLSNLMESNMQSSSQKRINRPSDDPVGAGRVISYRSSLSNMDTYKKNIEQAMGWLGIADSVLGSGEGSVQSVLNRMMTLAEQGATGTYDADNRQQISFELRQDFLQLINLANTTFEGRRIFAGHKTDQPAYVEGLGVTSTDSAFDAAIAAYNAGKAPADPGVALKVEGASAKTVIFQMDNTGPLAAGNTFRYSNDSGKTWHDNGVVTASPDATSLIMNAQDLGVTITATNALVAPGFTLPTQAVDRTNEHSSDNGTWLYVRPTAIYQGDDDSNQVTTQYGAGVTGSANGYFQRDVAVRIDSLSAGSPPKFTYSYSTDDGNNWTQATAPLGSTDLPIPGGYLTLSGAPTAGQQFVVHPHRADIDFQIADTDRITVNMVGKDIFGGLYDYPEDAIDHAVPVTGDTNLFDIVGNLIAAAETNSQQGMQEGLKALKEAMNVVLTATAVVGGRENRLIATHSALSLRLLDEEDNLSQVEDVDVTELMTKLAQQQVAYNSVLKSSSMIMQMSLVNFL